MKAKNQYTIRNVPDSIDQALKRKAADKGVSLNSLVLDALSKEAGIGAQPRRYHDLDWIAGTWVADPECDRILREQRVVDPKDWR